ncbi:unnamed protein product, partial [Pylaiella littoralis]
GQRDPPRPRQLHQDHPHRARDSEQGRAVSLSLFSRVSIRLFHLLHFKGTKKLLLCDLSFCDVTPRLVHLGRLGPRINRTETHTHIHTHTPPRCHMQRESQSVVALFLEWRVVL